MTNVKQSQNHHTYSVVDATLDHVQPIAAHLRQADVNEVWASSALTPRQALEGSIQTRPRGIVKTWLVDGVPAAMGGIHHSEGLGIIWLLGTDIVDRHRRAFLTDSKREFEQERGQFNMLCNWIDVRNRASIRWLKWLGFEMEPPRPYGPFRMPFHFFHWRPAERNSEAA